MPLSVTPKMNRFIIPLTVAITALTSCTSHNDKDEHADFRLPAPAWQKETGKWTLKSKVFPDPSFGDVSVVSPKAYWETQMTKLPMAVGALSDSTIIELTPEMAEYYAGPHYKSQFGTRPYLVRAIFWNYTGAFSLQWHRCQLYVSHTSLGGVYGETKLPLVVNLRKPPVTVYTVTSSASH